MRSESVEKVKEAVYQAGLSFLNRHQFLVKTKKGRDFIDFCSSRYNHQLWASDRTANFINCAEDAGRVYMHATHIKFIPNRKDIFNEAIGRAMHEFIMAAKAIEMPRRGPCPLEL